MNQIHNKPLLSFSSVYPEEEMKEPIEYLKETHPLILRETIGMLSAGNKLRLPNTDDIREKNYDFGFIENLTIQRDVIKRVEKYFPIKEIGKPYVITRLSSLKMVELILSNKLIPNGNISFPSHLTKTDIDKIELNLFKAFLALNEKLNKRDKEFNIVSKDVNSYADLFITKFFPIADIGNNSDNEMNEFNKLLYATLYKFDLLIEFLKSKSEYDYLIKDLIAAFGLGSIESLIFQMRKLLSQLLALKFQQDKEGVSAGWNLNIEDNESRIFINSLISSEIKVDSDFTVLKDKPLHKVDANTFSVIDFFFAVDKFYKSVKFILKSSYHKFHDLNPKDRKFFSFFNKEFSEETLCKNVLDEIFPDSNYIKKQIFKQKDNEPDYYARDKKTIFLFECKDSLVAADIKSAGNFEKLGDIKKIDEMLKKKFLLDGEKDPGIGQLVNQIDSIVNQQYKFDTFINKNSDFEIYPVLLVCDRIFDVPGLNYKLNNWYWKAIDEKLGDKKGTNTINSLTIVDIDTLIYLLPHFTSNKNNFKNLLDTHLKEVNRKIPNKQFTVSNINKKLLPFSRRLENYKFPPKKFVEKLGEGLC